MDRLYQGFIFTKHALERLQDRSITQDMVVEVLRHPTDTYSEDKKNTTKFIKVVHDRLMHVVATYLPDKKQWLVVSVWVRGEEDRAPLSWQIISWPFKLVWRAIKKFLLHT